MHNQESVVGNETQKILWKIEIQMDHLVSSSRSYLTIINNRKRTCRIMDFYVPADHSVKSKECKKRDTYLDLARELKKLLNMKVTIIPIVIGALGSVTCTFVQGLGYLKITGRVEAIKITALLRLAR